MKFSLYQGGGFESANVNGLWFAGTLMHGNDWRRSSGGFIHGFRYLVRSLGKILELENHAVAWPSRSISVEPARVSGEPAGDTQMRRYVELATAILKRSSESSGPYQMFGVLMDVRNLLCFYTAFSSICTLFCSNLTLFDSLVYSTLPSTVRFTCSARTGAASGTCIYAVCFVCTCRRLIDLSLIRRYDEVPSGYMPAFLNSAGMLRGTDHSDNHGARRKFIAVTMRFVLGAVCCVYTCRRLIDLSLIAGTADMAAKESERNFHGFYDCVKKTGARFHKFFKIDVLETMRSRCV